MSRKIFCILISWWLVVPLHAKVHRIVVLHTNDLHAHLAASGRSAGAAAIAGYFKQVRAEERNVLVLDAGDYLQGPPISAATKGRAVFEVMDLMGYSSLTLGNHEFDYGAESLQQGIDLLEETPIISCNVLYQGKPLLPPSFIISIGELKVAVVGGLGGGLYHSISAKCIAGFEFLPLAAEIQRQATRLNEKADLVIAITHQGFDRDLEMAERVRGIDVIIGGHDHGWHDSAKMVGVIKDAAAGEKDRRQTVVASAAPYGKAVGRLELFYDDETDKLVDFKFRLVTAAELAEVAPLGKVAEKIEEVERSLEQRFGRKLATVLEPLNRKGWEKPVGSLVADGLAWAVGAEIGLTNTGGLRDDLPAGEITVADIWKVIPFDNTICTFNVTGKQLINILERYASRRSGALQVSGLSHQLYFSNRGRAKIGECSLALQRSYRVSTTDYVCQQIEKRLGEKLDYLDTGRDWRVALEEYVTHLGVVEKPETGRIKYVEKELKIKK